MDFNKNSLFYILCALLALSLHSCVPQIHYLNVDVRRNAVADIPQDGTSAVFSVIGSNDQDSIRLTNVAIGLAEKLEEDRNLEKGSLSVWSLPEGEFVGFPAGAGQNLRVQSLAYLNSLSARSGANTLYFVDNLTYLPYISQNNNSYAQESGYNVVVPFKVDMNIYDASRDSVIYSTMMQDSLYLNVDSSISPREMGSAIAKYLPAISKKIGSILGKDVTPQWVTQQRMLITYDDAPEWEEAYELAADFRWTEAIDKWMEVVESRNPKKSAFAAYNIAIGCEMVERFDLALKWLDYSLEIYPIKEVKLFREYIKEKTRSL